MASEISVSTEADLENREIIKSVNSFRTCSREQTLKNQNILNHCENNWENWGIHPRPDSSELRGINECPISSENILITSDVAKGCTEALLALPFLLAETALIGVATLSTSPQKNSFAYVSQNGSLQEIKAYLTNEYMRSRCGIGQYDIATYVESKCPDRQAILNESRNTACRSIALAEIEKAKSCTQKSRIYYRSQVEQLDQEALQIYRAQQQRKLEEQSRKELTKRVETKCGSLMNPLKGSTSWTLNPILALSYGTIEANNFLKPNSQRVEAFNNCVAEEVKGDVELQNELLISGQGFIAQVLGQSNSIQCYNERVRSEIYCKVAHVILSGGSVQVASQLLKKLGKTGAQKLSTRFASRAGRSSDGISPLPPLGAASRGTTSSLDEVLAQSKANLGRELTESEIASVTRAVQRGLIRDFKVKACVPSDCEIKKIIVRPEDIVHIDKHNLNSERISTLNEILEQGIATFKGLPDSQKTKSGMSVLDRIFTQDGSPIRKGQFMTYFPDGVTVDKIVGQMDKVILKRTNKTEDMSKYEFEVDGALYRAVICRRPDSGSGCIRDGIMVTQENALISLYPVCGKGVKQLPPDFRVSQLFKRLSGNITINDVLVDKPC